MTMTIKNMLTKSALTKSLLAAAAAGALLFSVPAKSDAQVVIAARFGRPAVVVAPAYAPAYGYRARRDAYIRHEEWLRARRFDRYHYGYR